MKIKNEGQLYKDKLLATLIHFFISLVVMTVFACLIFFVWYPYPFYQLFAVKEVFWLLVMIDVVLGPLCTFIVYKKNKKTLKMDLTVIGLIQLLAFSFGLWSIAEARPAWLVVHQNIVYAVSSNMLVDREGHAKNLSIFKQNWLKPTLVLVNEPVTPPKEDIPIIYQYDGFQSVSSTYLKDNMTDIEKMKDYKKEFFQEVIGNNPDAKGYFPIVTEASMNIPALLINDSGEIVDIVLDNNFVGEHTKK